MTLRLISCRQMMLKWKPVAYSTFRGYSCHWKRDDPKVSSGLEVKFRPKNGELQTSLRLCGGSPYDAIEE
jgi:hypothetical protein